MVMGNQTHDARIRRLEEELSEIQEELALQNQVQAGRAELLDKRLNSLEQLVEVGQIALEEMITQSRAVVEDKINLLHEMFKGGRIPCSPRRPSSSQTAGEAHRTLEESAAHGVAPFRVMRLDLPTLNGEEPYSWAFKIEQIFNYQWVPEGDRVALATQQMEGAAIDWY